MRRSELDIVRINVVHPYAWLWEPLESDASFVLRSMFGSKAVYLNGKLMFCFMTKAEPWGGLLVATDREQHASLVADFPTLSPHPVLRKWLYLRESSEAFEQVAEVLVRLARQGDSRIGVTPQPRKRKRA
jgi:hypothetical protein